MLWIHYLVGVNHFAKCENRPVAVSEMLMNVVKISYSAMVMRLQK